MCNLKCEIWNVKSEMWNLKCEIWNVKSERWNLINQVPTVFERDLTFLQFRTGVLSTFRSAFWICPLNPDTYIGVIQTPFFPTSFRLLPDFFPRDVCHYRLRKKSKFLFIWGDPKCMISPVLRQYFASKVENGPPRPRGSPVLRRYFASTSPVIWGVRVAPLYV